MTDINQIGELAAAKVKSIAKTKANLDERSKMAAEELSQVWDALEKGTPVNNCTTKAAWAAKWKITTRQCNYILRGRKPRTGEHKNRAVPIKEGMLILLGGVKYTLSKIDLTDFIESGIAQIKLDSVSDDKKPAPKKKVKRYSTKVYSGDWMTFPGKPHKTHKMRPDGKRTWCGKTPGDTLAIDAKMSDSPTCRGCQTGMEHDAAIKALEQSAPVTHAKYSSQRTVCEKVMPNLPRIKGKVWAAKQEEATCPNCIRVLANCKTKMVEPAKSAKNERRSYTHAKVSPRKTLCEDHIPNRHIGGRKFAKKWKDATCPDCVRFIGVTTNEEPAPEMPEPAKIVTHRVGVTDDGGSQHGRLRTYTLCGRRFSGSSWTTTRHVNAHNETPTCEKCLELMKPEMSESARALAAAMGETAPARFQIRSVDLDSPFQQCGNLDGDDENEETL